MVAEAENQFNVQHAKVADMLVHYRSAQRSDILRRCSGSSMKAKRNLWSYVNPSKKQTSEISVVIDPSSDAVKCDLDEITDSVQNHLIDIYNGSFEKIVTVATAPTHVDHAYAVE